MACAEKKVISLKNVNDHSSAAISGNGEFSVIVGKISQLGLIHSNHSFHCHDCDCHKLDIVWCLRKLSN